MKFSTKAEYGLKAMTNLAKDFPLQKSIKIISQEEKVSLKYLERLIGKLKKSDLVASSKGKNGGYSLIKNPVGITVGEIVEALEGPIAPMKCVGKYCALKKQCASSVVWSRLGEQIRQTLYSIKLSDLIK